jgi:hypothetical protein
MSATGKMPDGRKVSVALPHVATMAGWETPLAQQANGPVRLTASGEILTGSDAGMESGGQLNPAHSRWLMGYPVAWDFCGATATQSSRKRRQSS